MMQLAAASQEPGGAEAGDAAQLVWVCSPGQDAVGQADSEQVSYRWLSFIYLSCT